MIIFLALSYLIYKFRKHKIFNLQLKHYVLTCVVISVGYAGLSNVLHDPYDLNIDRWQTIEYCIPNWINGKYFYDIPSFLGNTPSYLPGQLLLALPFYLLGNVGYLQVASFILFALTCHICFSNIKVKFQAILLFVMSLAYAYEVVCKSDFISSFIIVACFILLWSRNYNDDYFKNPILLGLLLGVLCLTRSVVIIPLILFLLKGFLKTKITNKIKVVLTFLVIFSALSYSVLFPAKDFDYVKMYNPFKVQGQANIYLTLVFVVLTIIASFFVKNIKQVFYCSSVLIFCLMGLYIVEQFILNGIEFYKYFAVTYFAASLPFIIVSICFVLQDLSTKENTIENRII